MKYVYNLVSIAWRLLYQTRLPSPALHIAPGLFQVNGNATELPQFKSIRSFRVYLKADWRAKHDGWLRELFGFKTVDMPLLRWDQDKTGHWKVSLEPGSLIEEMMVRRGRGASPISCIPPLWSCAGVRCRY